MSEDDISAARNTPEFREMMRFEVERAREWFERGLPLIKKVDRELAIDIELFSRGGQEILNAIERQGYAVLGRRPAISKSRKLALVARAALGKLLWSERGVGYERRRAAHALAIFADLVATRGGLFRMPQHHPRRGQEFLLRLPGPAPGQAPGVVRGVRLHAPLRRHRRRLQTAVV